MSTRQEHRPPRDWLVEEQTALRRVATLVAHGSSPPEVCAAVVEELGKLLRADVTHMMRFEPDGRVSVAAAWSARSGAMPVGIRFSLEVAAA